MPPTVVLIDDDDSVLASLEAVFETAGYAVHAFTSAEDFLATRESLAVCCVVTDLRMPTMDGLTLVRQLAASTPAWPTVVISGHADVSDAIELMHAGALDFLVKPFHPRKLVAAVESASGRLAPPAEIPLSEVERRYASLTPREKEVVEHLVAGATNRACGAILGISPRTVDVFRGRILRKMDSRNIAALSTAISTLPPTSRSRR
ncbi:response regulator transcription factor [Brevundimonas sp.]|uniref:response regulator transcription factor n=1 Tax=Brevundimonas sp. TaxID=1871086 RepID=UPI002BE35F59|nr:response regulator [Brevundimonas sp.]HWQ86600.1 response regulator [Brevundimonas sp.]